MLYLCVYRTEKNATAWSKDKLKSLLEGLILEDDKCKSDNNNIIADNLKKINSVWIASFTLDKNK